jgi:hypothetical protein
VLNQLMAWYLREPGAELPERPSAEDVAWINSLPLDQVQDLVRRPRRRAE